MTNKMLIGQSLLVVMLLFSCSAVAGSFASNNNSRYVYDTNTNLWPGGTIHCRFDGSSMAEDQMQLIRQQMQRWQEATAGAITFVDVTNTDSQPASLLMISYNHFVWEDPAEPHGLGYSTLGYDTDGQNFMRLSDEILPGGSQHEHQVHVILHELGHVIGLEHEELQLNSNFVSSQTDYRSIMHSYVFEDELSPADGLGVVMQYRRELSPSTQQRILQRMPFLTINNLHPESPPFNRLEHVIVRGREDAGATGGTDECDFFNSSAARANRSGECEVADLGAHRGPATSPDPFPTPSKIEHTEL